MEEGGLVPVHALPLPAAHLGRAARSLQYGTGLAVPAPWQPLWTPAATWNTHWQCLLIRR